VSQQILVESFTIRLKLVEKPTRFSASSPRLP